MAENITITANWLDGSLSNGMISRQYDNNRYRVQFINYPLGEDEDLSLYLIVWMKTEENGQSVEQAPIELDSDQWIITNYYTQFVQNIQFQLCVRNESGTFEAHSPIFNSNVTKSLSHDGSTQEIYVDPLFDAYKEYVDDLVIGAGAVVIDSDLDTAGAAADAKATGDAIAEVNERLTQVEGGGGGLTAEIKAALLAAFNHVAWDSDDPTGQSYITALQTALYPPANLSQITAVYTQPGTVWTTDTLDSLKANLVVTAYYTDNTHEVISNYTLSGTLSEGTRTITAAYGGKTATFTVMVSEYSTAPVIVTEGVVWSKTPPDTVAKEGFGITKWYDYTFSQENLESSRYWDETNQYMTTSGWSGIVIYTPDANTYAEGYTWPASSNFKHVGGLDGVYRNNTSITRNSVINWGFNRQSAASVTNNCVSFSIPLLDADDCYAYWHSSATGAIYPEGVSDGDIIFAGQNTPYFGMHNISEAET